MAEYGFGSGVLWGVRTDQANPTPYTFGTLQEVSIDFDASVKELFGQYTFPVAVGRGTSKITGKSKFAEIQGRLLADLYFDATVTAGSQEQAINGEADTVPSASTYTISVAHASTWTVDLGVVYASSGIALSRVAAASEATGKYSVASGVYTFAVGDEGAAVHISYRYTLTGGEKFTIANKLLGTSPTFGLTLYQAYSTQNYTLQLNQCVSTKLSLPTKQEDFLIQEFDFSVFADASNNIGVLSTSNAN